MSGMHLVVALIVGCTVAMSAAAQDAQDMERDELGRRITTGMTTTLAFKNVTVERLIPFIVESTGKVVVPRQEVLSRRITILNDEPIPQQDALDLVFLALQQEGIAVVETREIITLRDIAEISRQDVPVISSDQSVLQRRDYGTIAEKVYPLAFSNAEKISELIEDTLPEYATIGFDEESNQIVVMGNIALLQRMERLISSLDRPSAASLETATFVLRFADAEQVAENIQELYEDDEGSSGGRSGGNDFRQFFGGGRRGGGGDNSTATGIAGPSENLRVTANTQQNSVTVLAEPTILEQVRRLIETVWDQPLSEEAVVPRIYDLQHTDPVRVQALLEGLFGSATSSGEGGVPGASGAGIGRLAGQFSFQAIPEAGRLVAISKSPDNLFVIDEIIAGVDQPQTAGLPVVKPLKHANAEELAEQLNSLLAREGTLAQIPRQETGLGDSSSNVSPFATPDNDAGDGDQSETELITFWWQRAQPPTDTRGASNLVGQIRIVPVWRQNAVMVLSPPEYKQAVLDMIEQLDEPGRQVLISAVVAEIALNDATSLGFRWSSSDIDLNRTDNAIGVGTTTTAQADDFLGNLFDTSVLDVNADLNIVLQLLNEKADLNILSEPKIFTADNQEAEFFDGQDIPFVTDVQLTDTGVRNETRQYRAVGINFRARPRITINRDVDLRVNLELSSIQAGQTIDGQFIVDRRETTTQLIVQDGQTVVISGILRSQETDVRRKVPILGDIPILNWFFSSIETEIDQTELVAFITPIVVDNTQELEDANKPFRERLDQLRETLGSDMEGAFGDEAEPLDRNADDEESER
jgi:general secretion pathway protein D